MVHLRTVPDAWQANVIAARLGAEGILTCLKGNVSGPYPLGVVSVFVEEDQADVASELLLVDEVEAAFVERVPRGRSTTRRAVAALAAVAVAGAPLLAHFIGQ